MSYRVRVRPKYSDEELKEVYSSPWGMQSDWRDHDRRRTATLKLARAFINGNDKTAADLSCGDAYFAGILSQLDWVLGDFAPGYQYQGPIEETIKLISTVDVFFLCETLEHLDDPEAVLFAIRTKARKLILSTPKMDVPDPNPEHYWSWNRPAVRDMLLETGWTPSEYEESPNDPGYTFQIWGCV